MIEILPSKRFQRALSAVNAGNSDLARKLISGLRAELGSMPPELRDGQATRKLLEKIESKLDLTPNAARVGAITGAQEGCSLVACMRNRTETCFA